MKALLIGALLWGALPVSAQTARDSAVSRVQRAAVDSIRRTYPNTLRSSPRLNRWVTRVDSAAAALVTPPPVPPPSNAAPVARIALSCDPTTRGCSLDGTASSDDKGIVGAVWTFGDGATASGMTATHAYAAAGTYPVSLTVRDLEGLTNTATAIATIASPTPTPAPLPTPSGTIESITGPIASQAAIVALGGAFSQYARDFATYDEPQWAACGPRWDCIDYYDRAAIYYAWYQSSGDAKYLTRANATAVDFRTNYLEANNYGIAHHWAMMDGIALHFLLTGDVKSQLALARVGENFAWQVNGDPSGYFSVPTDFRINAYAIKSLLDAWLVKAPSNGQNTAGWPAVPDWAPVLRSALTKILALRDADGQWRGAKCFDGTRVSHPFTVGLLYDALYRYYTQFEADPRIVPAIKQSAEIMWRDDWIPTAGAFKYVGKACGPEGSDAAAGDLNMLILNGYAFIGKTLGDATFASRAGAIFAGAVAWGGVTGDAKHFNQQYTSSFRYFALR